MGVDEQGFIAAFGSGSSQGIGGLIRAVGDLFNLLIPVLIAAAVVIFFWGLVKYVWSGGKDKDKGKNVMIAGLLSLFVMVSVWGIIRLFQQSFGVSGSQTIEAPRVPPLPR